MKIYGVPGFGKSRNHDMLNDVQNDEAEKSIKTLNRFSNESMPYLAQK